MAPDPLTVVRNTMAPDMTRRTNMGQLAIVRCLQVRSSC